MSHPNRLNLPTRGLATLELPGLRFLVKKQMDQLAGTGYGLSKQLT